MVLATPLKETWEAREWFFGGFATDGGTSMALWSLAKPMI